jgi:hypothetical protein
MELSIEAYRGLDFQEDLFNHGKFSVLLKKGDTLGVIISTDHPKEKDALILFKKREATARSIGKALL